MKTISDHILDIIQNSVKASSTLIEIIVREEQNDDLYTLIIRDDGCGMTKETAAKALDPFFTSRTTRKVGLGLPLLKHNAEQAGGNLDLSSEPGRGTTVTARFGLHHIDRPPMGDIGGVFLLSAIGHPNVRFSYSHVTPEGSFYVSSSELRKTLGEVPLHTPEMMEGVREMIRNNLETIMAST